MAPRALSATLPKITKAILDKGGRDYATIIAEWPAIVGTVLAGSSQPDKLVRRRAGDERSSGAVLTVRVSSGAALEFQHREPQIIERINAYLGYRAVARLKLVQGVLTRAAPGLPSLRDLTAAESQAVESTASQVADPDLRDRLARFGSALAARATRPRR